MTVGLAGKACAGKDSLVSFFIDRGFSVVDADKIGHRALEANAHEILGRFGTIDRKALGKIVFSDPGALADLEALTHPWIAGEIQKQITGAPGNVVLNAALLHKQDLYRLCDTIIWVQAPLLARFFRARTRDRWDIFRIIARIWAQRKLTAQVFPADVDILRVDNRGSLRGAQRTLEARFGPAPVFPTKEDNHECEKQ